VITNESSSLPTPLPDEPKGFPEPGSDEQRLPQPQTSKASWFMPWVAVLKAILVWIASVLCLAFVPLILVIPYLVYMWKTVGLPSADTLASDKTLLFLSILGVIPAHLVTFGIVWLVVTEAGSYPFWKTIGFEWPKDLGPIKGVILCSLLAAALLGIGGLVTHFAGGGKTQLDMLIESSTQARLATAFIAFATAPLIEELIYRGMLYAALERAMGTGLAIALVSILFAGVHVFQYSNNLAVIAVIALLSVTLTTVRAITGKVFPSFVIHLVFNGIQSLILVFQAPDTADKTLPNTAPACDLIIHFLHRVI
jgi:CAAX protease family protein